MNLEGEQRTEDDYGPWMALVCLFEFNISWIFPEDYQEKDAEDKVAEELEEDGENCAVKNKWQNTICARSDASCEVHHAKV